MAQKTLIGGTGYSITSGKTLIGGTGYSITGGKTLIGGTGYDIPFDGDLLIFDGTAASIEDIVKVYQFTAIVGTNPSQSFVDITEDILSGIENGSSYLGVPASFSGQSNGSVVIGRSTQVYVVIGPIDFTEYSSIIFTLGCLSIETGTATSATSGIAVAYGDTEPTTYADISSLISGNTSSGSNYSFSSSSPRKEHSYNIPSTVTGNQYLVLAPFEIPCLTTIHNIVFSKERS